MAITPQNAPTASKRVSYQLPIGMIREIKALSFLSEKKKIDIVSWAIQKGLEAAWIELKESEALKCEYHRHDILSEAARDALDSYSKSCLTSQEKET